MKGPKKLAKKITTAATAAAAALPLAGADGATAEDAAFEQFFRRHLEAYLGARPVVASDLGDHRNDDRIEEVTPDARARWLTRDREILTRLERDIDVDKLTRPLQIDYEIFAHELAERIWQAENLRPFEEDPRTYNRFLSGSVYGLLTQSTLPAETNLRNSIARIRQLPAVVATARETLDRVPRPVLETSISQNRGVIRFYQEGIFELAPADSPQLPELREAAAELIGVLEDYQGFLEKDLRARATDGWRLGKDKFDAKLRLRLNAGTGADEVLADAEAEFARVERDLYIVARQLWSRYFPGAPLPPDDAGGRRETTAKVLEVIGRDHGRPEELLGDARATVAGLVAFIREKDILRLPEPDRCEIIEMPEFRRGNSLAYLSSAPPLDPGAATFYAISPPPASWTAERVETFLQEYNRHMLQVLTIHEAYPGHYVQLDYSNRCPSLVRRVLGSGVFIEGWAVYTEQMMLDQGYGGGDLALRMTQLKFYLRAVANAILDHRMHCSGMTDEGAMDLLSRRSFQSEGEARLKIVRAKQSSVQLSTYFVGRMAHYRLRQEIQREMGEAFDLGRYHEAVLAHGSVPVKYLPELVRARLREPR